MRKTILLLTALIVTFGAFAKGPMTASAPSLAAVFGHFGDDVFEPHAAQRNTRSTVSSLPAASQTGKAINAAKFVSTEMAVDFAHIDLAAELALFENETVDRNGAENVFDANGWMTLPSPEPIARRSGMVKSFAGDAVFNTASIKDRPVLTGQKDPARHSALAERTLKFRGNIAAVQKLSSSPVRDFGRPVLRSAARQGIVNVSGDEKRIHVIEFVEPELRFFDDHQNSLSFGLIATEADSTELRNEAVLKQGDHTSQRTVVDPFGFADTTVFRTAPVTPAPVKNIAEPVTIELQNTHSLKFDAAQIAFGDIIDRETPYTAASEHSIADMETAGEFSIGSADREMSNIAGTHFIEPSVNSAAPVFEESDRSVFVSNAFRLTESHIADAKAGALETDADRDIAPMPESAGRHSETPAWASSFMTTSPEFTAASLERSPIVPAKISKKGPVVITGATTLNTTAMSPSTRPLSNTPAMKAAAVVTGIPTLNVAPMRRADGNYCDSTFIGEPIRFSQTAELTLEDLLLQIHNRFGINFLMGPNVGGLPINIKAGAIPWNVLLRSQLFVSGVRARCIDGNTIELIDNKTLPSLQDTAEVKTRFVKLKFLQRTSGGTVDLANRSQGGQNGGQGGGCGGTSQGGGGGTSSFGGQGGGQGGNQGGNLAAQQVNNKFDKLIVEIEKILGIRSMTESSVGGGGGGGGQTVGGLQTEERRTNRFVTQIPGRNILAIRATDDEHELIDQIIDRADRPPFQVVIKGLVYSANQDKLRDIGVQTTITGGTADERSGGGIFGHTIGAGGTLFDFSTIIGTFDFNVQATALQQNGVISVKSRPFATVLDGLCTVLEVGRQLPIVIDSSLGGVGTVTFVDASNNLAVTPYVIDDDNGDPQAVMLELRLAANDVDSSVTARGVPAVSKRSVQTQLLLGEDKTAILGGFTVDQDSRTVSKTPGLGDIPIIGELFKRRVRDTRINRLYFAISVSVIPYGEAITPVAVPGATTEPPSITPEMQKRAEKADQKQVTAPAKTGP